MLARMGLERQLAPWNRPSEKISVLKRLRRERMALIRDRNSLTNQLYAMHLIILFKLLPIAWSV